MGGQERGEGYIYNMIDMDNTYAYIYKYIYVCMHLRGTAIASGTELGEGRSG